jgi:WD40 repeat protein
MIFSSLHNTLTPPTGYPIQYSTPTIHYNYIYCDHPTAMYPGHFDEVLAVAWSPDGTRIVSGSYDGTVQIWNADGGNVVYTLRNGGLFVAWSPDGSQIASGGKDGIVKIWSAV